MPTTAEERRQKSLFNQGQAKTARLILFLVVGILMMIADHRGDHLNTIRATAATALYPLQRAVDLPVDGYRAAKEYLSRRTDLLRENADLRARDAHLVVERARADQLARENRQLRNLLEAAQRTQARAAVTDIVNVAMDPFSHRMLINKGSSSGAFAGQPVLDDAGVLGQVERVGRHTSTVILITDPNHALPVTFSDHGVRSLAMGTGRPDRLTLPNVAASARIELNEMLVTSGLGGQFPPGLPVARVTRVATSPGSGFMQIEAQPLANVSGDAPVMLVWPSRLEPAEVTGNAASADPSAGESPNNVSQAP